MEQFLLIVLGVIVGGLILLMAIAAFLYWRIQTSAEKKLAKRIGKLPFLQKIALAGSLFRDERIPIAPRLVALALVLYIASPIDLLPDFIPFVGYFDDLLIVFIGASLILRNIPDYIIEDHVSHYELRAAETKQLPSPRR